MTIATTTTRGNDSDATEGAMESVFPSSVQEKMGSKETNQHEDSSNSSDSTSETSGMTPASSSESASSSENNNFSKDASSSIADAHRQETTNKDMPSDEEEGTARNDASSRDSRSDTEAPAPVPQDVSDEEGVEAVLLESPSDQEQDKFKASPSNAADGPMTRSSVGLVPAEVSSFMSPNDFYAAWMEQQLHDDAKMSFNDYSNNEDGGNTFPPQECVKDNDLTDSDDRKDANTDDSSKTEKLKQTWKAAVDSSTEKMYYYDSVNRVTTWTKPRELEEGSNKSENDEKMDNDGVASVKIMSMNEEESIESPPPPPLSNKDTNNDDSALLIPQEYAAFGMTPDEYHEAWKQQVLRDDAKQLPPIAREMDVPGAISVSMEEGFDRTDFLASNIPSTQGPIEHHQERACTSPAGSAVGGGSKKRRRRLLVGTIVAVIAVIGAVLGLVLALTLGRNSSSPSTDIDDDTTYAMIFIQPDRHPDETSWEVRDSNGTIVHQQRGLASRLTTHPVLVNRGENYTFSITDMGSDGICCESGLGYYYILRANDGKRLLAGNGDFGGIAQRNFVP